MLKDKALENLAAGELLLGQGLVNSAASRLYYAMYEAGVHKLTQQGRTPGETRSGAVEWDHSMVQNNAGLLRGRRSDRLLFHAMRTLRVVADYRDENVRDAELHARRALAVALVRELTR